MYRRSMTFWLSPRVGVAYVVTSKMVLRAGYGMFFAPIYYTANSSIVPGYTGWCSSISPATRPRRNRAFQREIVGAVVSSSFWIS